MGITLEIEDDSHRHSQQFRTKEGFAEGEIEGVVLEVNILQGLTLSRKRRQSYEAFIGHDKFQSGYIERQGYRLTWVQHKKLSGEKYLNSPVDHF